MPRNISGGLTSEQITPAQFNNLVDKVTNKEITPNQLARILSKVDLGESYDDAQKGWSRFVQRSGKRIVGIPKEWAEAAQGGFGLSRLQDLIGQHGGGIGTAAFFGEIAHGSTIGMLQMAKELVLGHGDLGDAVEIASVAIPLGRLTGAAKLAKFTKELKKADPTMRAKIMGEAFQKTQQEATRRLASGDTTPVKFEVYKIGGKDGINITKAEFDTIQSYGAIDRRLNYAETIAEGIEIVYNPDEIFQTLAFSVVVRGAIRIFRGGNPEQFGDEYAPLPVTDTASCPSNATASCSTATAISAGSSYT